MLREDSCPAGHKTKYNLVELRVVPNVPVTLTSMLRTESECLFGSLITSIIVIVGSQKPAFKQKMLTVFGLSHCS